MVGELLTVIVVIAILGFATWLVTAYVPMPEPFKRFLIVAIVLVLLFWVVRILFGVGPIMRGLK
jgi:hypothetical protein